MEYVKNVLVAELATFGLGIILTVITGVSAIIIMGINDYDVAFTIGYDIGVIGGLITRAVMLVVLIATIIRTKKES